MPELIAPVLSIGSFFEEKFQSLSCRDDTKAYIVNTFKRYRLADQDLSRQSITLLFSAARQHQNFAEFQNIGDWLFVAETMFPASLAGASIEYYQTLARISYYTCFNLLNRKWVLYQELADCYPEIVAETKCRMLDIGPGQISCKSIPT